MTSTATPPLVEVAREYLKAGWHPIELPEHSKGPPAEGRTGYGGSDLTLDDVEHAGWMGNIGVRMPGDVIGLDFDMYRGGKATLEALRITCGPLPLTWISHSGRDDGSGIRFFRVPVGLAWITGLAGMDIIQRTHRYAAVWPSTHPDGRQYRWWDQAEQAAAEAVPLVEDLPDLPWPWIGELSRAHRDDTSARALAVDGPTVAAFVAEHTTAEQPSYVGTIAEHFTEHHRAGYSRHDTMQHCLLWALECVRAGVADARSTINTFATLWVAAVAPDARRAELTNGLRTTEFEAMLRHAVGKVNAKPEAEVLRIHDDIVGIPMRPAPLLPSVVDPSSTDDEPPTAMFLDWPAFAARDTSTARRWLVEGFWPWGRSMALWAAAKAGKSELALWCAAKLALGQHPWTGEAVEVVDVAYFDFEMTEDDLDERLSDFGFDPLDLGHLHYALLPPLHALDVERGGAEVETLVTGVGAQAVIFDTFGRAVAGDENEADTVRAFYRHTGSRLKRLGVGYVRTDHAGKDTSKGQRGTSAKRDDVDVVWRQTRINGGVLLDCSGSSRLSWVGPTLTLDRIVVNDDVVYTSPMTWGWPHGTAAKAAELDALGLPASAGRPTVEAALRAAGRKLGKKAVLEAAIKYRREPRAMGPELAGQGPGASLFDDETGAVDG